MVVASGSYSNSAFGYLLACQAEGDAVTELGAVFMGTASLLPLHRAQDQRAFAGEAAGEDQLAAIQAGFR